MADPSTSNNSIPPFSGLDSQEKLLWQGKTDIACLQQASKVATWIVFGVLFAVIIFLIWADWRQWYLFILAIIALIIVNGDKPTETYIITDKRIATYGQNRALKNQDLLWSQVGQMRLSLNQSGTGTISFYPIFLTAKSLIIFRCISEASEVHRIATEAKQAADQHEP